MALSDSDVLIPGLGYLYTAPAETAVPASLTAPAGAWVNLGHTSRDDGLTITRDGGDTETVGTWQNASLRSRVDPSTYAITAFAQQIDNTVLGLYFGGGDASVANEFSVTSVTGTTDKALYIRIIDGATEVGLYIPKVSITADDDVEVDVEGFLSFPLRATVLQVTGEPLMTWYRDNLGA